MLVTSSIDAQIEVERVLTGAIPAPTTADIQAAVAAVKVADTAGLAPTDPLWTPTYDTDLAVAEVADLLAVRAQIGGGLVSQWSSEGTTVQTTPTNWPAIAAAYRARSVTLAGASGWNVITLEQDDENLLPTRSSEFDR